MNTVDEIKQGGINLTGGGDGNSDKYQPLSNESKNIEVVAQLITLNNSQHHILKQHLSF